MGCDPDDAGCREALDQLYEYLDGELDAAHLAAVRHHLETCSHCAQQYGLEREVRSMIVRSCTCLHAPDELRRRILTTIAQLHVSTSYVTGPAATPLGFLNRPSDR